MVKKYKYDVAFSFLAEDEPLVNTINDLIKGRLNTFIYSEKQNLLVGTDGEASFSKVFAEESRIVIILYRSNWGKTKWTRIEETAIKNRAYEDGYDFTLFIALEQNIQTPKWLPKTQLWYGMERYGLNGVAGVIEAQVQRYGGVIKTETSLDKAAQLAADIENENKRGATLNSERGLALANADIDSYFILLKELSAKITQQSTLTKIQYINQQNRVVLFSNGISLDAIWYKHYVNTLSESSLIINIREGFPQVPGYNPSFHIRDINEKKLTFDLDKQSNPIWRDKNDCNKYYSISELADYSMKLLIDQINIKIKNGRKNNI